ncbi:Basic region leucine zipper [Trichostrongylus colubriformis]|uniref:Basic region leucine zipper n=1 Tax=Trichostrongylus colubriformis TaxID=6319 RepID=A0AAN8IUG4_TRICO
MTDCSSPVPSMSCDESADKDEVSSMSSPPHATLTVSNVRSSPNGAEVNELKSAFRTVLGSPIPMQQRLLAMLQNEWPQPRRSNLRSASSEPCSSANDILPTKGIERRADEKEADYYERRRKNNDSARRSREVRRQREVANRQQVEAMEKENVQLRAQIALLRLEINQLSLVLMAEGVKPVS